MASQVKPVVEAPCRLTSIDDFSFQVNMSDSNQDDNNNDNGGLIRNTRDLKQCMCVYVCVEMINDRLID